MATDMPLGNLEAEERSGSWERSSGAGVADLFSRIRKVRIRITCFLGLLLGLRFVLGITLGCVGLQD